MNRGTRVVRRAQHGVILFVALIVLVAMSLTGIALIRSVDTNVLVAGNLAFRQGATAAGDWGVEAARSYLKTTLTMNSSALNGDQPSAAYYATWQETLDLYGTGVGTPFNWASNSLAVGTDSAGNEVRYVLHRMCAFPGAGSDPTTNCVKTADVGSGLDGSTKQTVDAATQAMSGKTALYYRVTVRILGPRNTLSFVQAMLK
jgi:type IV pilus assembly protein PilX